MNDWWKYDNLPSGAPYDWSPAVCGDHEIDKMDFHLDIGCGTLKKGRLGIDRHAAPGVDLVIDLERLAPPVPFAGPDEGTWQRTMELYSHTEGLGRLPFPDDSIESIISHHCMEHIGDGFVRLMDECHRVLVPGGILRIIVPLFPSRTAVEDPDHRRVFMAGTFETFCGASNGAHWHESFSVPYTTCRFEMVHKDTSPPVEPEDQWGEKDAREIRVALRKYSLEEVAQHDHQIQAGQEDAGDGEPAHVEGHPEGRGDRELAGVA